MKLDELEKKVTFDSPEEWFAYGEYLSLIGIPHRIDKELVYKYPSGKLHIHQKDHIQYLKEFDRIYNHD